MEKAECRGKDTALFFPERGKLLNAEIARFYCSHCDVKLECRDYQQRTGSEYGIWGGEFANKKEEIDGDD